MSKELGTIINKNNPERNISVTRFWGGDSQGISVQLTQKMEDGTTGYVQLNLSDLLNLIPVLKTEIMDEEMGRRKREAERLMKENEELRNSIVNDIRKISDDFTHSHGYELINMLTSNTSYFQSE